MQLEENDEWIGKEIEVLGSLFGKKIWVVYKAENTTRLYLRMPGYEIKLSIPVYCVYRTEKDVFYCFFQDCDQVS